MAKLDYMPLFTSAAIAKLQLQSIGKSARKRDDIVHHPCTLINHWACEIKLSGTNSRLSTGIAEHWQEMARENWWSLLIFFLEWVQINSGPPIFCVVEVSRQDMWFAVMHIFWSTLSDCVIQFCQWDWWHKHFLCYYRMNQLGVWRLLNYHPPYWQILKFQLRTSAFPQGISTVWDLSLSWHGRSSRLTHSNTPPPHTHTVHI